MAKLLLLLILVTYSVLNGNQPQVNVNSEYNYSESLENPDNTSDTVQNLPDKRFENGSVSNSPGKVEAYNTQSEKLVGEVSAKATQNSNALISCKDRPDLCAISNPVLPSPTSYPSPEPTIINPTIIPIPTLIPEPTIIPKPSPPICIQTDRICPMIACVDGRNDETRIVDGCECPCYPYWKEPVSEVN